MADRAAYMVTIDADEAETSQLGFARDECANPNLRKVWGTKRAKKCKWEVEAILAGQSLDFKAMELFSAIACRPRVVGRVTT